MVLVEVKASCEIVLAAPKFIKISVSIKVSIQDAAKDLFIDKEMMTCSLKESASYHENHFNSSIEIMPLL